MSILSSQSTDSSVSRESTYNPTMNSSQQVEDNAYQNIDYDSLLESNRTLFEDYISKQNIDKAYNLLSFDTQELSTLQNSYSHSYKNFLDQISQVTLEHRSYAHMEQVISKTLESMPLETHLDSVAYVYHLRQKGRLNRYLADYDQSLEYLNLALEIGDQILADQTDELSDVCYDLGVTYAIIGDFDMAKQKVLNSEKLLLTSYTSADQKMLKVYNALGLIHEGLGAYEIALSYHEKTIYLKENSKESTTIDLARSYLNQANLLLEMEQPQIAYQKLLPIIDRVKTEHPNSDIFTWLHNAIGKSLIALQKPDQAIHYLETVLTKDINKLDPSIEASLLYNLGIAYTKLGQPDTAIPLLKQSRSLFYKDTPRHAKLHEIDLALAKSYIHDRRLKLAKEQAEIAYKRTLTTMPKAHPAKAKVVNLLAEICIAEEKFEEARGYLEEIKILELVPAIDQIFNYKLQLQLANLSRDSLVKDLIYEGETYIKSIPRANLPAEERYRLSELIKQFYVLSLPHYIEANNEDAIINIFDKTKNSLLKENIMADEPISYRGIPDHIRNKEISLARKIRYLEKSITYQYDSNNRSRNKSNIRALDRSRTSYDTLLATIKKDYPKYYKLKFGQEAISKKDILDCLEDSTVVFDYIISDSVIWILSLTKDKCSVREESYDKVLEEQLIRYHNILSDYEQIKQAGNYERSFRQFATLSTTLYDRLLRPVIADLDSTIRSIKIIPDGLLNFIPFESLIRDSLGDLPMDYRKLDYMIKNYDIAYGYSLSLGFAEQKHIATYGESYIGFAPSYSLPSGDEKNYAYLEDMPSARESVSNNAALFEGAAYLGSEASIQSFLSTDIDSEILHMAMHCIVDHKNPAETRLVFSNDHLEQNSLTTYALYDKQLHNELCILAACSTGDGELRDGEGVMSLSRAFSYAGTQRLIMSLWNISDVSSAELTTLFLQEYKQNHNAAVSLKEAKLNYLDNAPRSRAHPFYWSAFVVSGNIAESELGGSQIKTGRLKYFMALGLILMLAFIFFRKKLF